MLAGVWDLKGFWICCLGLGSKVKAYSILKVPFKGSLQGSRLQQFLSGFRAGVQVVFVFVPTGLPR